MCTEDSRKYNELAKNSSNENLAMPTVAEVKDILQRHLVEVWFPRCLDKKYGGFLCDFNRQWQPHGSQEKLLEFQSRQTWIAALLSQLLPDNQHLQQATLHGFSFLRDVMWDHESGGWFHRTNQRGEPIEKSTKHTHGIAYGLAACLAVYRATNEIQAYDLARTGFTWLEEYAWDKQHGGYFGFLQRDGTIILDPSQCSWPTKFDTIGTKIGRKDVNVQSDVFETFIYLHEFWSDPQLTQRIHELTRILCDKMISNSGIVYYDSQPDWTSTSGTIYGNALQTVRRLLTVRDIVGDKEKLLSIAQKVQDFALCNGWDSSKGGFLNSSTLSKQAKIASTLRNKHWWLNFEGLRSLLALSCAIPDNKKYIHYFKSLWHYILNYSLDERYGGSYFLGWDTIPIWRKKLPMHLTQPYTCKGNVWKDASHEGWAYLDCISTLQSWENHKSALKR